MNRVAIFVLFTSVIFWSCKKEESHSYVPVISDPKWECVSAIDWFENIFVKDSIIYLIGLDWNYKIDSAGAISRITPYSTYVSSNLNRRSKFSGKYLAQYRDNGNYLIVTDLKSPLVRIYIDLDSLSEYPGKLKCWGDFNNQNEFMISTQKGVAVKFSFSDNGDSIFYTTQSVILDSINPASDISKIQSSGQEFYISYKGSMYRYSNSFVTEFSEIHLSEMGTLNDTIYASVYGSSIYSNGVIASVDQGQTWQQIVSNFRNDQYMHSYTANKILLVDNTNRKIMQVYYDWSTSLSTIKIVNSNEKNDLFSNFRVVYRLLIFKEYIYAATSQGLYRRKVSELELL